MRKWYLITILGLMWTLVAGVLWLVMYIQWATNSLLPAGLARLVMLLVGDGFALVASMLVAVAVSLASVLILLLRYGKPRKGLPQRPQHAPAGNSAAPVSP